MPIERTPNPCSLKFIPGIAVSPSSFEVDRTQAGLFSPAAFLLYELPEVATVFMGEDFITVSVHAEEDWQAVGTQVARIIEAAKVAGYPFVTQMPVNEDKGLKDSLIVQRIKAELTNRIGPAVAGDGGSIVFVSFDSETGILDVDMQGACRSCPASQNTLSKGVMAIFKATIPEVSGIRIVPPTTPLAKPPTPRERILARA